MHRHTISKDKEKKEGQRHHEESRFSRLSILSLIVLSMLSSLTLSRMSIISLPFSFRGIEGSKTISIFCSVRIFIIQVLVSIVIVERFPEISVSFIRYFFTLVWRQRCGFKKSPVSEEKKFAISKPSNWKKN